MSIFLQSMRRLKKLMILVVGGTIFLFGVVLLVTPGPAFMLIAAGLGILAIEFAWARNLLKKAKSLVQRRKPAEKPHTDKVP